MTTQSPFKGPTGLWPVIDPNENLIHFVIATSKDEYLQNYGPRPQKVNPKPEEIAFSLATNRLVAREFRDMITNHGLEFGLTNEQIRLMTAAPKKAAVKGV